MSLTRQQILDAEDMPPLKLVNVPEWGGDVYLRGMTAKELDAHEQRAIYYRRKKGNVTEEVDNVRASKLVKVIVDEAGKRLFMDADVEALGAKYSAVISRLWDESEAMTSVNKEAIDEAEKNSEPAPSVSTATT